MAARNVRQFRRYLVAAAVFSVALALWRYQPAPDKSTGVTQPTAVSAEKPARSIVAAERHVNETANGVSLDGVPLPADTSPSLAKGLSPESGLTYEARLKVIHALSPRLTEQEHETLLAVVVGTHPLAMLTDSQRRAFKNDILNVLARQPHPARRAAVAEQLRIMARDPELDAVMRDYALQHLADMGSAFDDGAAHLAALEGSDSALAATAMLHLLARERTGELTPELRARIAAVALCLAGDAKIPPTSRATALQVCGRLRLGEARAIALSLAQADREAFPLRIAAVATLGDLGGDAATRDYLTSLTNGPEKRLRVPAQSALRRFAISF